ncbi:hypothetical protein [Zooshikella sp. RANM57]|uniref:hypothetical protein n=1 Tax=Zooshikella sp. RANM57 TaxID=3425863 RepID=UPI003D6EC094
MQLPDIEIYVKNTTPDLIEDWLDDRFDSVELVNKEGRTHQYNVDWQGMNIPVMVVERAAGRAFTSIWFNSAETPWETDIECARDAFEFFDTEIRCNGTFWQEEEAADNEWWRITHQGEGIISWQE